MGLRFEKIRITRQDINRGATKICRLSWLTNSALVYEPNCGKRGRGYGVSANEYSCTNGAKIKFGDLTTHLIYVINPLKHVYCRIDKKKSEMQTENYNMLIRKAVKLFI
jgi:hypothetical protein